MIRDYIKGAHDRYLAPLTALIVRQGYYYLNLDRHPELVDTRTKGAIAALEGTLRSQGIPLFPGEFLLLYGLIILLVSLAVLAFAWTKGTG